MKGFLATLPDVVGSTVQVRPGLSETEGRGRVLFQSLVESLSHYQRNAIPDVIAPGRSRAEPYCYQSG
jgi:hypothetical protein